MSRQEMVGTDTLEVKRVSKASALETAKRDGEDFYDYSDFIKKGSAETKDKLCLNIYDIEDTAVKNLIYQQREALLHISADFHRGNTEFNPRNEAGQEATLSYIHNFATLVDTMFEKIKFDDIKSTIKQYPFSMHEMGLNYDANKFWEKENPDAPDNEKRFDNSGRAVLLPSEAREKASEELTTLIAEYMSFKYGITTEIKADTQYLSSSYYLEQVREQSLFAEIATSHTPEMTYTEYRDFCYERNVEDLGKDFADKIESQIEEGIIVSERNTANSIQALMTVVERNQDGEKSTSVMEVSLDLSSGQIRKGEMITEGKFPEHINDEGSLLASTQRELRIISPDEEKEPLVAPIKEVDGKLFIKEESNLGKIFQAKKELYSEDEIRYPREDGGEPTMKETLPSEEKKPKVKKSKSFRP